MLGIVGMVRPAGIAASVAGSVAALALLLGTAAGAKAQGTLEARYAVSLAGIPIGKAAWTVEVDGSRYTVAARGSASGMLSILFDSEGRASAHGRIEHGRPVPRLFVARTGGEADGTQTTMHIEAGAVADLHVAGGGAPADLVPLAPAHRQGVVDPLTALLVPMTGAFDVLSDDICRRTLPVFDGQRRYDLVLSFKRMEQVRDDAGFDGPAIVCAAALRARAGHRIGGALVKYFSEGRDIELWLAPVAGTRMLAPFRASVAGLFGPLVVQATRFDTRPQATAAAHGFGRR